MSAERRSDVRTRIKLPAHVVRRSGHETVEVIDASYRGLFIRMHEAPPIRELIKLRITLPTGAQEIHAVVMRVVFENGRPGVGLRFFALNGEAKSEWETFISQALQSRARAA